MKPGPKILVVDDDEAVRSVARKLLQKAISCTVLEAPDGLEGLTLIHAENPDLVLLDICMPVLDGVELLEAMRSDVRYAHTPVVVLTSVAEKEKIRQVLRLGVSDYLLKPLNKEIVEERLRRFLATPPEPGRKRKGGNRNAAGTAETRPVLVVDADPHFRAFVSSVLEAKGVVRTAATAMEALQKLRSVPSMVLIGENLPLVNERMLARKLREFEGGREAAIYLCVERKARVVGTEGIFDGMIQKSFVPARFLRNVEAATGSGRSTHELVMEMLAGDLGDEVRAAVRHTIGVLALVEVSVDSHTAEVRRDVCGYVDLSNVDLGLHLRFGILTSVADAESLGRKILRDPPGSSGNPEDTFGEVVRSVAERLQGALRERALATEHGPPVVVHVDMLGPDDEWIVACTIRTPGNETLLAGVRIMHGNGDVGFRSLARFRGGDVPAPEGDSTS